MREKGVLLHTCCAPCLTGARIGLKEAGVPFQAFWYNPNIQPQTEHDRRLSTLKDYRDKSLFDLQGIDLDGRKEFEEGIAEYLKTGSGTILGTLEIRSRCDLCYLMRLSRTAHEAKKEGLAGFTTTLLLSKYQRHDRIKAIGELISSDLGIEFLYIDLRRYWGRSLDGSRKYKLYRQKYCGCEMSSIERLSYETKTSEPVHKELEIRVKPCDQYQTEYHE